MPAEETPSRYFRRYRNTLGFTNQADAKKFLGGKDLVAPVNMAYAEQLRDRIKEIVSRLQIAVTVAPTPPDIDQFIDDKISFPFNKIIHHNLLPRLNNQGRRPEEVLFSWLRGYATAEFFVPALIQILGSGPFTSIGGDNFTTPDRFRRSPTADYSAVIDQKTTRLEIQSGFQSISDIKEHKVREAKRRHVDEGTPSLCIHLDVFNGQAAFVRLDQIADNDINWVTRQQMEGQTVFSIDQNDFKWRLTDAPPSRQDLELDL